MAKAERGTIKWLSNRMKSKGLQRLRWYCQMCEKQCRDENGFKCHMASESHVRRMSVFNQRPGKYIDEFSREFETDFMRLMRTKYCRARVLANSVYCEMIANKEHVHMNATHWVTLNGFIRHLEETEQVKAEWDHPRGPFIVYIDKDRDAREKAAAERLQKYAAPDEVEDRKFKELEKQAKLEQTKLEQTKLEQTKLEQTKLEQTKLEQTNLKPARLEPARLEPAGLEPAGIEPAIFEQPESEQLGDSPASADGLDASHTHDTAVPVFAPFVPSTCARLEVRVVSPIEPIISEGQAPVKLSFSAAPVVPGTRLKKPSPDIASLFKTKKRKQK
ncbi:putative KIN17 [Gregarina niphandrodes]|uniref:KIN17 n=1 Tax=Gregarina niphandrodes TaxID=110365 RepID=A0A023B6T6_GRENI|nr:putative KIN17 [Gregarina niphandrodes]EZG66813.1 putative KIN17 [Gregarina niphandrodes]|eukprot:XP_011130472.1 putative KIN17 [Gregarina niphandrodes]